MPVSRVANGGGEASPGFHVRPLCPISAISERIHASSACRMARVNSASSETRRPSSGLCSAMPAPSRAISVSSSSERLRSCFRTSSGVRWRK